MSIKFQHYDIEVLRNIYTIATYQPYQGKKGTVDIFYFTKDMNLFKSPYGDLEIDGEKYVSHKQLLKLATAHILKHNPIFKGNIRLYNIAKPDGAYHLLETFGISNNSNNTYSTDNNEYKYLKIGDKVYPIERFVRDTDPEFEKTKFPFLVSYNGYQYDTTVLAALYDELFTTPDENGVFTIDKNCTTESLRVYNDQMFTKEFKSNMYKRLCVKPNRPGRIHTTYSEPDYSLNSFRFRSNMLKSGRYIDAARLNEKMTKVALKRLLGMLGCQIMESDKIKPNNPFISSLEEMLDLFAYNASDVINLDTLLHNKFYISAFEQRDQLLSDYPELIYMEKGNTYKPNIHPDKVRRDRLYRDSTSSQLTAMALFPYSKVKDYKYVSYNYPSQQKCDELNAKFALEIANGEREPFVQRNILEEMKEFYYKLFPQPHIREKFDKIYDFYKNLEGKNFNASSYYQELYPGEEVFDPYQFKFTDSYIHYYDKDGNPTGDYANFSIGGIHGAEWNIALFDSENQKLENLKILMSQIKGQYPDAVDFRKSQVNLKVKGVKSKRGYVAIDGKLYKTSLFIKGGKKVAESEYKDDIDTMDSPFTTNSKDVKELDDKFKFTTVSIVNHEDFTSYYPSLLIMMSVFYNERLGYDRYNEIFEQKEHYGVLMKDSKLTDSERIIYNVKRNGTKLMLNAATGAGGAPFDTNIRANNAILSMRAIGQMFTFMVAQYQAYYSARVPSTNTDGLYTIMEEGINNKLLSEISANIGVAIKPEIMYLISKDANNRCELVQKEDGLHLETSAGSIGSYDGPEPNKSLSHAAIIDRVLVEYMIEKSIKQGDKYLTQDFDRKLAKEILSKNLNKMDNKTRLLFLQNVLSSSPGIPSYVFSSKNKDLSDPEIIQLYNRTFLVTENDPNKVYMQIATARKLTPATINKRKNNNEILVQHEPLAQHIMTEHGYTQYEELTEASLKKIPDVDLEQPFRIYNGDLSVMSNEEVMSILKYIDVEAYITLIEKAYMKSWQNIVPEKTQFNELPFGEDNIITKQNYKEYIDLEDVRSVKIVQDLFGIEVA